MEETTYFGSWNTLDYWLKVLNYSMKLLVETVNVEYSEEVDEMGGEKEVAEKEVVEKEMAEKEVVEKEV